MCTLLFKRAAQTLAAAADPIKNRRTIRAKCLLGRLTVKASANWRLTNGTPSLLGRRFAMWERAQIGPEAEYNTSLAGKLRRVAKFRHLR
jgi:hypothetical protein